MTVTQAIIFHKDLYDTIRARRWLRQHHYTPIKRVHETTHYLRYRIREPDYDHFEYKTKRISSGVKIVVGIPFYQLY